jgi:hypothetical protein
MNARYADRWYRTMTYIQTARLMGQSGQNSDQSWYVAQSLPGRLRIDYGNPELGNGIMFHADTSFQFSNGRQVRTGSGWNELFLMTQDVYTQPPQVTASVLRSLGYQMSRLRTATFDGKSAYIIGSTSSTDSASKQFWVDRDRLLLVRIRERRPDGQFSDIQVGDFVPAGNGFIAKQVLQLVDGRPRLHQVATQIKADVPLDSALFDPKQWATVKHWSKP